MPICCQVSRCALCVSLSHRSFFWFLNYWIHTVSGHCVPSPVYDNFEIVLGYLQTLERPDCATNQVSERTYFDGLGAFVRKCGKRKLSHSTSLRHQVSAVVRQTLPVLNVLLGIC